MSNKKYRFLFLLIIIIVLVFLNVQKFTNSNNQSLIPVWSSYEYNYYNSNISPNIFDRIKKTFNPERLIYGVSKIRLRAPITYLKREIPLLAYYTPEDLREPEERIYYASGETTSRKKSEQSENYIKLQFDLR